MCVPFAGIPVGSFAMMQGKHTQPHGSGVLCVRVLCAVLGAVLGALCAVSLTVQASLCAVSGCPSFAEISRNACQRQGHNDTHRIQ